jgi:hypothetical protein
MARCAAMVDFFAGTIDILRGVRATYKNSEEGIGRSGVTPGLLNFLAII